MGKRDGSFIIDRLWTSLCPPSTLAHQPSSTYGDEWPCKKHDKTGEATYKFLHRANYGIRKEGRIRSVTFHPCYTSPTHRYKLCTYVVGPLRRAPCMARERPYLIKQRVLTRRPYTFPPCEMPLSIYERLHVTSATSHTFSFYFTTRAPSGRPLCLHFRTFSKRIKSVSRFSNIVHGYLQNLLNPEFLQEEISLT